MTLTGTTTLANYQTALRTITYQNSGTPPTTTTRTISFIVNDGTNPSTPVTCAVNVRALPVVTITGEVQTYIQNQTAAVVASVLTLTDISSQTLASAQVSITNFVQGQDILTFVNQNGITGSFNATTGILTLTGTTTLANYQAALRTITYQDSSTSPTVTTRVISFTVNDGIGTSSTTNRNVYVRALPVIGNAGTGATYTEGQAAVPVSGNLTVTSASSQTLASAQVSITNFVPGEDVLAFVNQNGITGSFNTTTGILTLSGTTSLANYQTALRSITYKDSSASDPNTTTRTVSFTVNDGKAWSLPATCPMNVICTNATPLLISLNLGNILQLPSNQVSMTLDASINLSSLLTPITGATLEFTSGYLPEDSLSCTVQNGITCSFSNGVLSLSPLNGQTSVLQFILALQGIVYNNAVHTPGMRVLSLTVQNGCTTSLAITYEINVVGIASSQGSSLIDGNLSIGGTGTLSGGSVGITGGLTPGDTLGLTQTGSSNPNKIQSVQDISVSYDAGNGVLSFGSGSVEDMQSLFRRVSLKTQSPLLKTITFSVNNGTETRTVATRLMQLSSSPSSSTPQDTTSNTAKLAEIIIPAVVVPTGIAAGLLARWLCCSRPKIVPIEKTNHDLSGIVITSSATDQTRTDQDSVSTTPSKSHSIASEGEMTPIQKTKQDLTDIVVVAAETDHSEGSPGLFSSTQTTPSRFHLTDSGRGATPTENSNQNLPNTVNTSPETDGVVRFDLQGSTPTTPTSFSKPWESHLILLHAKFPRRRSGSKDPEV